MDPALAAQYEHDLEVRVCVSGDAVREVRSCQPQSGGSPCSISPSRLPRPPLSRMRTTTREKGRLSPASESSFIDDRPVMSEVQHVRHFII